MRALKSGSYTLVVSAVVLALVVVLNLIVSALPTTYTKLDVSSVGLLELDEETEGIVSAVNMPVTMYLIAQRGGEDATILELLHRYEAMSPHITVKTVDPDTNPGFVSAYTDAAINMNSVIVESELRSYVVDNSEIYVVSYENMTEEDYYNYIYYGIQPSGTPYFYGELMFTTAIDYVTVDTIPTVYTLTGHSEDALSETVSANFYANNIDTAELDLLTAQAVPADCSAIMLNNPKTDITTYESEILTAYLTAGGNMILVTDFRYFSAVDMPNLAALTEQMGMRSEDGLLIEGNSSGYIQYPFWLIPVLGTESFAAQLNGRIQTTIPRAHGIVLTGEGEADTAALLKTTTSSYVKKAGMNLSTYEKEEGDAEGSFAVAASATLGESKFVWYASPYIFDDSMDYYVGGGNSTLFITSVNWMCEKTVSVSVVPKTLQVEALVVPALASVAWGFVLTIALPIAILGGGFIVWLIRRRR